MNTEEKVEVSARPKKATTGSERSQTPPPRNPNVAVATPGRGKSQSQSKANRNEGDKPDKGKPRTWKKVEADQTTKTNRERVLAKAKDSYNSTHHLPKSPLAVDPKVTVQGVTDEEVERKHDKGPDGKRERKEMSQKPPPPPPSAVNPVVDSGVPGHKLVRSHETRTLEVTFRTYYVPDIKLLAGYSSFRQYHHVEGDVEYTSVIKTPVADFKYTFLSPELVPVRIPSTLVDELAQHWLAGKADTIEEYETNVLNCIRLCRKMNITAEQEREAVLWAPYLAACMGQSYYAKIKALLTRRFIDVTTVYIVISLIVYFMSLYYSFAIPPPPRWYPWDPSWFSRPFFHFRRPPAHTLADVLFNALPSVYDAGFDFIVGVMSSINDSLSIQPRWIVCEDWWLPYHWLPMWECSPTWYRSVGKFTLSSWFLIPAQILDKISPMVWVAIMFLGYTAYYHYRQPWFTFTTVAEEVGLLVFRSMMSYWSLMAANIWYMLSHWAVFWFELWLRRKYRADTWSRIIRVFLLHTFIAFCGMYHPAVALMSHMVINFSLLYNLNLCETYELSLTRLEAPKSCKKGAKIQEPWFEGKMNRKLAKIEERQKSQVLVGIKAMAWRPVAYASNYWNELQALYARVVKLTPVPNVTTMRRFIRWSKMHHKEFFGAPEIHSVSFDKYIENSNASPSVKRILRETHERLKAEGIDEDSVLTPEQLHEWTRRKAFVKVENNVYRTPLGRKEKAPRLIQGAPPEFIVLVGPYIAALQAYIKKKWNVNNYVCFTSGVKTTKTAKFVDVPGWTILEDDVSAWDASIGPDLCRFEVWFVKQFGAPRSVVDLMRANVDTHGVTAHGIKYKVPGGRKSGDPYTSVFNSVLNGLMHVWIYHQHVQCPFPQLRSKIKMLVQGDDNLCVHEPTATPVPWAAKMRELGFEAEAITRSSLYEAEFCSSRIYPTSKGLNFGPKPGRVLNKIGYFVQPPHNFKPLELLRGVALGLFPACSFIPPLRAYIDRCLQITSGITVPDHIRRLVYEYEWKMKAVPADPVPETYCELDRVYGWSPSVQSRFETALSKWLPGSRVTFPLLYHMMDCDSSGPQLFDH